jgi:hypothetical protein
MASLADLIRSQSAAAQQQGMSHQDSFSQMDPGMERYLAGQESATRGVPLEAPMLSPDDLIGSGLLKGLLSGAALMGGIKSVGKKAAREAPQAEALRLAQQRAALPVKKGGLGLPVDNTPQMRADAMGWKSVDDEFYRGQHTPPMSDSGAPAHDLTGNGAIYPDDVYSSNAARYYGSGDDTDASLFRKLQALRGKPDESVRIFRAVPKGTNAEQGHRFNHGDWVTPNRQYAVNHGESALNGEYDMVAGNVPAKTIFTNGDSPYEFGLDKSQYFADGPASIPLMTNKGFEMTDRSRFAAFDPWRRNAAIASAMGVAAPDLLAAENPDSTRSLKDLIPK